MFNKLTMTGDGCSPWPPVLQFTPEVQSGYDAAAALAFGPYWDTPMCELPPEVFAREFARYAESLMA
jgi:hypothetical protein